MAAFVRRVVRFAILTFAGIAAVIALLVTSMFAEHFLGTELPPPTGAYNVGRTSYFFTDSAGSSASGDQQRRQLVVWIWYPAQVQSTSKAADYFPAPWLKAANDSWSWIMTHVLTRDLSKVRVHSVLGAPVSPAKQSYPVLIMRPGGSALTLQYSTLAEDLASHGYVVVGLDAPYRTQLVVLPEGEVTQRLPQNDPEEVPLPQVVRLMMMWTEDVRFVLDRLQELNDRDDRGLLTRRLDLTKIGVFGHSFGGATALQVCHDDSRCKAGIDIDGMAFGSVIADGVKQPFMFLGGDHHREPKAETQPVWRDLHAIYERLPANGRVALMIDGADHYSFADGGVLKSHIALAILRRLGLVIDGKRQLVTTAACVRAFFGKYLTEEVDTMRGCTELQGVKPVGLAADGE